MVDNGLLQALHLSEAPFLHFSFFLFAKRKKKKEKKKKSLQSFFQLQFQSEEWRELSVSSLWREFWCSSERQAYYQDPFSFNFQSNFPFFFLAPMSTHPKEKPPPPPPPFSPPPSWPHTGCVKMGSFVLPLVSFLDLCIFALIRKLWGENPKKASDWGK